MFEGTPANRITNAVMRSRSRPHGQQGVQPRLPERAKVTEIANLRLRAVDTGKPGVAGNVNRLTGSLPDAAGMPPAERRCSASLYIGKSASKPIGNDWPTCNFCPEFPGSDTEQSDTSGISRDITV